MSQPGHSSRLQGALEKWKKDQARVQALQTQISDEKAKKAKAVSKAEVKPRATSAPRKRKAAAAPEDVPADMKAHLRSVVIPKHKGPPLSKQLKDVLAELQKAQEAVSAEQLAELTGHNTEKESPLAELLAKNPKVEVISEGLYKFRAVIASTTKVTDKDGVYRYLQSTHGAVLHDLIATYPGAEEDVVVLQAEGLAWVLPGAEKGQKVVFAREQPAMITVTKDVLRMWHEVEVPDDPEEQLKELRKGNIVSAVQKGVRARPKPAKKEKKKRAFNYDRFKRITNEHMPELFQGEAATSID